MSWWKKIWPFGNNLEVSTTRGEFSDWDFTQLTELYFNNPWLAHEANHDGLEQLWFDYDTREERLIIKTLLEKFKYLTFEEAEIKLRDLLIDCSRAWGISPANTIFVAIRKTKYADGSSMFLQFLKSILVGINNEWQEHNLISEMKDGIKYAKVGAMREQNQKIDKVVLIDDFVGTGETAKKQIIHFTESMKGVNEKIEVYFLSLGGMNFGLEKAREADNPVRSAFSIKKGIEISFSRFRRRKAREKILQMEGILADQIKTKLLTDHSLGWKGSEALYNVSKFNIPNNVFPIFWWKMYSDNRVRKTLFNRMQ